MGFGASQPVSTHVKRLPESGSRRWGGEGGSCRGRSRSALCPRMAPGLETVTKSVNRPPPPPLLSSLSSPRAALPLGSEGFAKFPCRGGGVMSSALPFATSGEAGSVCKSWRLRRGCVGWPEPLLSLRGVDGPCTPPLK